MRAAAARHRQRGAVMITVAMSLLFLLGFMGIALDFGHMFVVKSELQTAMDSCALAAAQELDGNSDALTRARSAGTTAGNMNKVNFQSGTWSGKGRIIDADFTFRDSTYTITTTASAARYAECAHTQSDVTPWLLQAIGAFRNSALPDIDDIAARAVATRASAQSSCPVPLAYKPNTGTTGPKYGLKVGDWITLIVAPGAGSNGNIGWANLDGSNDAAETQREMNGVCGTKVGDTLGTPGTQTAVADNWNYRFGIYKNTGDPAVDHPDFTGYAYTTHNWPVRATSATCEANPASPIGCAYNGATPAGADPTAASFVTKRLSFASCDDTGTRVRGANSCESITSLSLNSFTKMAAPGNTAGGFKQYGTSRRIVTVPVINGGRQVTDYLCMLLLQPLSIPMTNVQLEFVGNAGDVGSPCVTNGLAGGSAGPLVPVLVR
jgi:hypothetical protein